MYRIVSPSRASAAPSFTKVWAREGVSERRWRSAANRSPLPLRSVRDAPPRGAGPEPAGETGVGSCPGVIFSKGGKPPLCIPPRGRALPRTPSYEAGLRSRLPPRSVLDGAHRAPGPPSHPPRARLPMACRNGVPTSNTHPRLPLPPPSAAPPPLGEAGPLYEGGDGRQWRPSIADRGGSRDMSPKATGGVRTKSHCVQTYYELSSLPLG